MTYLQSLPNFYQRLIMSLIILIVLTAILIISQTPPFGWLFVAALTFLQALALYEYYLLAQLKGFLPSMKLAITTSALLLASRFIAIENPHYAYLPAVLIYASISACALSHMYKAIESIANLAITLFGLLYITLSLSWILELNFRGGLFWVVYAIAVTKASDTSAYIFGKTFGKNPLSPFLSPKKTVEGAIGGLLGSCIVSVLLILFFPGHSFCPLPSLLEGALLGLIIGAAATFGDLVESLLKRDANVKDSGTLPGLGGALDMVDSLIFTIPLLYIYLRARAFL